MLILTSAIVGIIIALRKIYVNGKQLFRLSNHYIPIESQAHDKSGKKQAVEAISNLVEIPILPEISGGTISRDWFAMLYRIEKNKLTTRKKQQIALDLIRKNKRDYANSKMSPTGSTVPAECLWLIFETLMHRRRVSAIKNTLTIIVLFGYIEWLIITRLI